MTPSGHIVRLSEIANRAQLAACLSTTEKGLCYLLYALPIEQKYRRFEIPKKTGGIRPITAPVPQLRNIQLRVMKLLESEFNPRAAVNGFVIGKSIKTNALSHVGKKWVLNIDLADFFRCINFGRVRGLLISRPYNCVQEVATAIAQICVYENELPQGAPSSPIISNMICAKLDSELARMAKRLRNTYTRYADDITFSCNSREFPKELAHFDEGRGMLVPGESLRKIIEGNDFTINHDKFRLYNSSQRQEVTGLVVNQKPNVRRTYIREVRAMLDNLRKHGLEVCESKTGLSKLSDKPICNDGKSKWLKTLKGKIDHVGNIRGQGDKIYLRFLEQFQSLMPDLVSGRESQLIELGKDDPSSILDRLWVIHVKETNDEVAYSKQGTGFFLEGVGLVTCAHVFPKDLKRFEVKLTNRSEDKELIAIEARINFSADLATLTVSRDENYSFSKSTKNVTFGDLVKVAGFPDHTKAKSGEYVAASVKGTRQFNGIRFIVIDKPIFQGNSGGPVFDLDGNVIGIAAMGITSNNKDSELGFYGCIPVDETDRITNGDETFVIKLSPALNST